MRRRRGDPRAAPRPAASSRDAPFGYRDRLAGHAPHLARLPDAARRIHVAALVDRWLTEDGVADPDGRLLRVVVADTVGLGPLEPLLADDAVTEVMVNGADAVVVEVDGRLVARPDVRFRDAAHLRVVVDRLVAATGRRLDDGAPMVDARLPDGSRVNAVLPPIAVGGPHLSIRRPSRRRLDLGVLVASGSVDGTVAAFLHAAVLGRCNLLVTGAAAAGKTTVLSALCDLVPDTERLVVLEDVVELRIDRPFAARQECRPPAPDGGRGVSLRDLVRNALRMRPDRIVVGEVRGPEAADMVAAMSTGHDGSMGTLHASSPADALLRLESMLALGWSAPSETLRRWIATAVDVVVHCERAADGRRRVTSVAAVDGVEAPEAVTLFRVDRSGDRLDASGEVPRRCLERMARHGVLFPPRLFARGRVA